MSAIIYKSIGIFAQAEEDARIFVDNLFLTNAVAHCAELLVKAEKEYQAALVAGDAEQIEQKELQLQTCQSSMLLTAHILDEVDGIST
jgi:hypothetical protein